MIKKLSVSFLILCIVLVGCGKKIDVQYDSQYGVKYQLDDLSKLLNLNQSYFCRLFKQATNSTFIEYLNFVRVCKAEKLLFTTNKTVSEISMDVGFSSVSYFNRVFKKIKKRG